MVTLVRFRPAAFVLAAFAYAMTVSSLPLPVRALPGQSDAQFRAWVKKTPDLGRNLVKQTDELSGWPEYSVLAGDHGVAWKFGALEDASGNVREETFTMVSGPGELGSTPIRHDGTGYGFKFFSSQLGVTVTADFKHAKLVPPFTTATGLAARRFYRGAKYGWIDDGNGTLIHLLTFKWFDTAVATAVRCAKPGATCAE